MDWEFKVGDLVQRADFVHNLRQRYRIVRMGALVDLPREFNLTEEEAIEME